MPITDITDNFLKNWLSTNEQNIIKKFENDTHSIPDEDIVQHAII